MTFEFGKIYEDTASGAIYLCLGNHGSVSENCCYALEITVRSGKYVTSSCAIRISPDHANRFRVCEKELDRSLLPSMYGIKSFTRTENGEMFLVTRSDCAIMVRARAEETYSLIYISEQTATNLFPVTEVLSEDCYINYRVENLYWKCRDKGTIKNVQTEGGWYRAACICEKCGKPIFGSHPSFTEDGYICDDCIEELELVECSDCGYFFPKDEVEELGENTVCKDCKDHWAQCEEHGYWFNIDNEGTFIDGEGYICDYCLNNKFYMCHDCEKYFRYDYTAEVRGGDRVCERCLDRYYSYCDHCEEYVLRDETSTVHTDTGEEIWCDDCAENNASYCDECGIYYDGSDCPECSCNSFEYFDGTIRDYHSHGRHCFKFMELDDGEVQKMDEPDSNTIYFGVELEGDVVDGIDGDRYKVAEALDGSEDCYLESDGSLNNGGSHSGVECITMPCTLDYHLETDIWDRITKAYYDAGLRSQDAGNCGLHVHVSMEPFRKVSDYRRKFTYAVNRAAFVQTWKKLSRRRDFKYCSFSPIDGGVLDAIVERGSHHTSLNIDDDTDTIEFRFNRGTLKVSTIKSTLWLINAVCQSILEDIDLETCTFAELTHLADAPFFVREYCLGRGIEVPEPRIELIETENETAELETQAV